MAIKLNKLINFDKAPRVKPTLNQKKKTGKKCQAHKNLSKFCATSTTCSLRNFSLFISDF